MSADEFQPKLVRDGIPEAIRSNGGQPHTHTADSDEFHGRLVTKIHEELTEYLTHRNPGELADLLAVVYALAETDGVPPVALDQMRADKARELGEFATRTVLDAIGPAPAPIPPDQWRFTLPTPITTTNRFCGDPDDHGAHEWPSQREGQTYWHRCQGWPPPL